MTELDDADKRLLRLVQEDASLSLDEMAQRTAMSTNTVWRRLKRLEDEGVLLRRVALVDPARVGAGVTVFVAVRTNDHSDEWLEGFARAVRTIPEVVEFYRMAGETDYLLKLAVASIADYDRVYRKLIRSARLHDVSSTFAMETIKYTTALPIQ